MCVKLKALSFILPCMLIGIGFVEALQKCYDTGNFTINSIYARNLDLILSSLPSHVSAKGAFFTARIGINSDQVYALDMCSGDSSRDKCYNCVNSTIQSLIDSCPNQKEAFLWGVNSLCLVRYAYHSFFGILDLEPSDADANTGNITSSLTEFDKVWESLMESMVRKASSGSSIFKYATGEADLTAFQKIYALMQCTPDLSKQNCDTCLRQSVARYESCCRGKQGGYVQMPNCWFRWDLYPFYASSASTSATDPSLSPPPQSTNKTITKERGGSSSLNKVIIVALIVIVVAVLAVVAVACLFKRIKKAKQDDLSKQDSNIDVDSLQFELNAVRDATENFSDADMVGRGGFGPVYKVCLKMDEK